MLWPLLSAALILGHSLFGCAQLCLLHPSEKGTTRFVQLSLAEFLCNAEGTQLCLATNGLH